MIMIIITAVGGRLDPPMAVEGREQSHKVTEWGDHFPGSIPLWHAGAVSPVWSTGFLFVLSPREHPFAWVAHGEKGRAPWRFCLEGLMEDWEGVLRTEA